jgi:hypothetical protein
MSEQINSNPRLKWSSATTALGGGAGDPIVGDFGPHLRKSNPLVSSWANSPEIEKSLAGKGSETSSDLLDMVMDFIKTLLRKRWK